MKNAIKNYLACFKTNQYKALLITYAVCICTALFINLAMCAANFALSATVYKQTELTVDDFELVGAEYVDNMTIINATNDTQMIYTGNIRKLAVKCTFSLAPGEFLCFYNSKGDYSFGTHKMQYSKVYGDYYIFEFPYGTKQVRMDTGVEPSITVSFDNIVRNDFSTADMLGVSTAELFTLLIVPGVIYFGLDTLLKILEEIKKK